ncbi:hypothetical protein N473_23695 [Pseudoalteromonas luteoviolacea CPMOR-1]|uniref:AprE-like beta-barrel domain-containing protein n=1 Tax=Pseudoalteromonas luteoviolacea CPMOR-1 TaxID=1365248 RepID=A0A167J7H7_9GAMM|nr:HlyD family efflux transporter periplasmic adaptor subunit [Pseudoalteromonas luteoviolacea]KZN60734.1 hypothetical protein N473_23695 [Pseudoalteromonas luteoviolacea CPMOR-1]
MAGLFRTEAIAHQGQKLDGDVTIATHFSFNWILVLIMSIVVIGLIYLFVGEYHRKEVVTGYLRPTAGVSKVYPVSGGIVDQVFVDEGEIIKKGDLLFRIRMDRLLASGVDVNDTILNELNAQKRLLEENLANQKMLAEVNIEKLDAQITSTAGQVRQAKNQQVLLEERIALNQSRLSSTEALVNKGVATKVDLQQVTESLLAVQQQAEDIHSRLLSQQDQLSQLKFQRQQMPISLRETQVKLRSQLAGINQKIFQASSQRSYDVRSLRDGKVSGLLIKEGMMAQVNMPLMSILPENATLEAVLFVPTRAYGFIEPKQQTRIRYQAFPYQRFGLYSGQIESVSKTIVLPNETILPISIKEPIYQVIVNLESQNANAYGAEVPLQAGMLLEADIMVDSRSLFEWLFEPIYSIKGAM